VGEGNDDLSPALVVLGQMSGDHFGQPNDISDFLNNMMTIPAL
jgi:hypothetical protein